MLLVLFLWEIKMKAIVYVDGKSSPSFTNNSEDLSVLSSENIDSLPDAVFEEIELLDVLEFSERPEILEVAIKKLRHGGKIRITGTDALQVIKSAAFGMCDLEHASSVMLGGRNKLVSAHNLKEGLSSVGLNVTLVGIMGYKYVVEAQRQ
jgi:hypothetical protein|tara:strand:+ start:388 stop:837 length:450 start_codon:yes stop_codon:yes gene_type:complete